MAAATPSSSTVGATQSAICLRLSGALPIATLAPATSKTGKSLNESSWIKALSPNLTDLLVGREIDRLLTESFRINLKIMLIIDDLSAEQKDTINNVIRAFRLENGESINFLAYVVRLEQKINVTDANAEYALSVQ
jgi:hypothetical protein